MLVISYIVSAKKPSFLTSIHFQKQHNETLCFMRFLSAWWKIRGCLAVVYIRGNNLIFEGSMTQIHTPIKHLSYWTNSSPIVIWHDIMTPVFAGESVTHTFLTWHNTQHILTWSPSLSNYCLIFKTFNRTWYIPVLTYTISDMIKWAAKH